uniref:Uncharacterized protein n=1 Tax=Glossina austeni TaxID=7395 RepID=A0A1A9V0P5_GLOAU
MISASVLSAFVVHLNNPASVTLQSLRINLRLRPSLITCIRLSCFISSSLCHHCTSPVASSISQARNLYRLAFQPHRNGSTCGGCKRRQHSDRLFEAVMTPRTNPVLILVPITLMRQTPNTPGPKQSLTNLKLNHKIYSLQGSYK